MPLNVSKLGLNIIQLISNIYVGVFLQRAGLDVTTCMLEKQVMVNPSLPRCKSQTGQPPLITDRPPTRMEPRNIFGLLRHQAQPHGCASGPVGGQEHEAAATQGHLGILRGKCCFDAAHVLEHKPHWVYKTFLTFPRAFLSFLSS